MTFLKASHEKHAVFRVLYGSDSSFFIHLDARKPGVEVPPSYKKSYMLILQVGADLPIPVADLVTTNDEFKVTLSFERQPFPVVVPWTAVFFMAAETRTELRFAWPRDCPPEMLLKVHEDALAEAREESILKDRDDPSFKKNRRAIFSVIDGGREEGPSEQEAKEKPALSLVKDSTDEEAS